MTFYLGNFRIDSTIAFDVEQAAKKIKRDIQFFDTPMPIINQKIEIEDKYVTDFGCIAVNDGKKDCSKFWIEFNKIRESKENAD